jgi:branched-chain amino acid aminotransferase
VSDWRHIAGDQFPIGAKVGASYAQFHIARVSASSLKADDAVLLNTSGNVTETGGASIFLVGPCEIATPRLNDGILPSVTRAVVMALAGRACQQPVVERAISRSELINGPCVLLAGTLDEVRIGQMIDGAVIDPQARDVAEKLVGEYQRYCRAPTDEDLAVQGSLVVRARPAK